MPNPIGRPTKYNTPKTPGIYALSCPDTGDIRYVGKSKNMHNRLISHRHSKNSLPVSNWIQKLRRSGKEPVMSVIHNCSNKELDDLEIEEIAKHKSKGCSLLNLHGGGSIPASMGNGRLRSIWSIEGYRTPYMLLTQKFFCMRNNPAIKKRLKEISEHNRRLKTEPDKLNFQLWCVTVLQNHLFGEELIRLEKYAIKLAERVNKKYPGRLTIEYNDGIEDTPKALCDG